MLFFKKKTAQNGSIFVVFLAIFISFFLSNSPVLASEVTGDLSTGLIETKTSTAVSSTTSTSSSNNTAPSCSDDPPGAKAPWLYGAIAQDSSSVLLYFTPSDDPVNKYVLEYGTKSGDYPYGIQDIGVNAHGQMTFLVKSLSSNTTYYFKVRGGNGCATGTWSNEISAKTKPIFSINNLDIVSSELETIDNPTPTQFNGYDVKVKVLDTNKKPVEGATVTLHSNPQTTKTDKNGIASFTNVETGEHKVLIAYNNYQGEQSVNLTGDVKEFDLNVTVQEKAILLSPLAYVIIGVLILIIFVLIVLLKKSKAKTAGLLIATLMAVSSFLIVPKTILAAGSLTVTQITNVKTYAETDDTYANGWKWTFDVTVPTNETALNMKFANWTSGLDSISVADNTRFYSSQSSNASNESSAIALDSAGTYSSVMNINPASDLDAVTAGTQIQITVEFKVPVDSADGSYSTTYGIQTIDPDIAFVAADKTALVAASIKGSNPDLANITVGLTNPLPSTGANGSTITWVSDTTSVVSSNGQTINRPFSTSANATIILTATLTKGVVTDTKTFTLTVIKNTGVQATPTFDPVAGAIAFGTTVTITSAGADAIYYITDGTDPTTASTRQSVTPLVINAAVTVKALAVKAGYDNSAIGSATYTQAAATVPSNIVLAVGSTAPVGGVTNVAIPAAGATDTTGAVTGWVTTSADKIKFTVTDNGGASTITIGGGAYTSGADYKIPSTASLTIVVTTTETGKVTGVRTFTVTVAGVLAIGDSYEGGIIAYILQSGDPGYDPNVKHGLIAATANQSAGIVWAVSSLQSTAVTGTSYLIGAGSANTDKIIAQGAGADPATYAAGLARAYTVGVYDDWFLPSYNEMVKLYAMKVAGFGDFGNVSYWSSSQHSTAANALNLNFNGGIGSNAPKSTVFYVRAVRAF